MTCSKWFALGQTNITLSELKDIVLEDFEKNIKDQIAVVKESLSKTIRSKTSASDERTSSASLGWLAIFFVLIPFVLAVVIDCSNIFI